MYEYVLYSIHITEHETIAVRTVHTYCIYCTVSWAEYYI